MSICCCGCYGNQLSSKWFRLIERTKNAHYMCQISSQSMNGVKSRGEGPGRGGEGRGGAPHPPILRVTFFRLMLSRVKNPRHVIFKLC